MMMFSGTILHTLLFIVKTSDSGPTRCHYIVDTDIMVLSRYMGDDLKIVGQPEESCIGRCLEKQAVEVTAAHPQAIALRIESESRKKENVDLSSRDDISFNTGRLRDDPRFTVEVLQPVNRCCPETGTLFPAFPVRNSYSFAVGKETLHDPVCWYLLASVSIDTQRGGFDHFGTFQDVIGQSDTSRTDLFRREAVPQRSHPFPDTFFFLHVEMGQRNLTSKSGCVLTAMAAVPVRPVKGPVRNLKETPWSREHPGNAKNPGR
jgi:hypothetical protein